MKQLMKNIKARLVDQVDSVRDRDCFFTPDHNLIPKTVKLPCIGIKDGSVVKIDKMGGVTEKSLPVEISVYREFYFRDADIEDLFYICEQVVTALKEYDFNCYVKDVSVGDESEIKWLVDRDIMIIRKSIFFEYFKEE